MATFSKSLASCGGLIAGPAEVIDFLRIQSRPFLFTASGVPAAVGAALAATRICHSDEGRELFARVLANGEYLNAGLRELGFHVVDPVALPDGTRVATPIVPVLVADDWKARCCGRRSTRRASTSTSRSILRCRPAVRCCERA